MKKKLFFLTLCFLAQNKVSTTNHQKGWAKKTDLALIPYKLAKAVGISLYWGISLEIVRWFSGEVLYAAYPQRIEFSHKIRGNVAVEGFPLIQQKGLSLIILKEPDNKLQDMRFWWLPKNLAFAYNREKRRSLFWRFSFTKKMCKAQPAVKKKQEEFSLVQKSRNKYKGLYSWTNPSNLGFILDYCTGLEKFFTKKPHKNLDEHALLQIMLLNYNPQYSSKKDFPKNCVNVLLKGKFKKKQAPKE